MKRNRNSKSVVSSPVQVRQGDVFLNPVHAGEVSLPDKKNRVKPLNGRNILAFGEVTGHHHSLSAAATSLFNIDGKTVLVVDEATPLQHQEHGEIEVAPGTYWVTIQREYTPAEIRRVVD